MLHEEQDPQTSPSRDILSLLDDTAVMGLSYWHHQFVTTSEAIAVQIKTDTQSQGPQTPNVPSNALVACHHTARRESNKPMQLTAYKLRFIGFFLIQRPYRGTDPSLD